MRLRRVEGAHLHAQPPSLRANYGDRSAQTSRPAVVRETDFSPAFAFVKQKNLIARTHTPSTDQRLARPRHLRHEVSVHFNRAVVRARQLSHPP